MSKIAKIYGDLKWKLKVVRGWGGGEGYEEYASHFRPL